MLFGGGAKYSNGEDSLFIKDCLNAGMKIKAMPVNLGREIPRPSTWFHGYTEKFFYDRGVLYVYLYGMMAKPFAMRFMLKHKSKLKNTPESISYKKAVDAIMRGIDDTK